MSNQNRSKQSNKSSGRGRNPGRGRGGRGGGPRRNADQSLVVPMLRWGPDNNFRDFKEKFQTYAGEKYGKMAYEIIQDSTQPTLEEPEREEYDMSDPFDVAKLKLELSTFGKKREEMENNLPKLYACLYSYLSAESKDAVKAEDKFTECARKRDPYELWLIVIHTHKMDNLPAENQHFVQARARTLYHELKQGSFEKIVTFKERFDEALRNYEDYENPEMSDPGIAVDFMNKLDDARYHEFKTDMTNSINGGIRKPPKNLNDIFRLAKSYVVTHKSSNAKHGSGGVVYTTTTADAIQRDNNDNQVNVTQKSKKGNNNNKKKSNNNSKTESKTEEKEETKPNNYKKNIKCFGCGEKGHYRDNCPNAKKNDESDSSDDEDNRVHHLTTLATSEAVCVTGSDGIRWHEVLLDNQATVSVVHPKLLSNFRTSTSSCTGISGTPFELTHVGKLDQFFDCRTSEKLKASVLCMTDVEDLYDVTYDQGRSFTVHLPDRDLVFHRKNKLYVGDMSDWYNGGSGKLYHTKDMGESESLINKEVSVVNNDLPNWVAVVTNDNTGLPKSNYTNAQNKRAEEAWHLIRNAGYVSEREATMLVEDNNVSGIKLTSQDIQRAFEIYGKSPAYVRGRQTTKTIARGKRDDNLKDSRKELVLYSDVMHMGKGNMFLITLAEPLGLILSHPLKSTSALEMGEAVLEQLNVLKSKGYNPNVMYCDSQTGFTSLVGQIQGVEIDVAGAGDHLDRIDAKIRRIKETARSINSDLPWELPKQLVRDLVEQSVCLQNIKRNTSSGNNIAARVAFTGRKPEYRKELALAFGDYCEVYNPTTENVGPLRPRTDPCIALRPSGNANGSWVFWNLKSNKRVTRTNWTKMKTDQLVVSAMNNLAKVDKGEANKDQLADDNLKQEVELNETGVSGDNTDMNVENSPQSDDQLHETEEVPIDDEHLENIIENELEVCENDEGEWETVPVKRRSQRIIEGVKAPQKFEDECYHISLQSGIKNHGKAAKDAANKELIQLWKDKKTMVPVHKKDLTNKQQRGIIRSLMFLKEKYDGLGRFEKMKARLVANGAQQDRNIYENTSSPTVAMQSVMMGLTIAAKEQRHIAVIDIKGAYLNADMTGEEVYMDLDPTLTSMIVKMSPEAAKFVDNKRRLTVKLDKALYGCVQSAKLWYDTIAGYLERNGFKKNEMDACVMNKMINGKQLTVMIYVDDLLITSEDEHAMQELAGELEEEYGEITLQYDNDLSYLGMHINYDRGAGVVKVSMQNYVNVILDELKVKNSVTTPANSNLFHLPDNYKKLSDAESKKFHSTVAKLLYLAKRVRPDTLLAVSFLCTRTKDARESDLAKLDRVLKYLNGTREMILVLTANDLKLSGYIDAGFASHGDGMSHTGLVIKLGEATILCKSSKQKMVTKDSTEAELVGLSDKMDDVMKCFEFLQHQGYNLPAPIIYQDNMSTISLVKEGKGKYRSKYLRVRQARVKECIDKGELQVAYTPTAKMKADVFTKALQGNLFARMTSGLLTGSEESDVTGVR